MNVGEIRPGDKVLEQTLETVRSTPGEARKFASDPEGYLKSKGVATEGLHMGEPQGELTDQALEAVAGGTVCMSVGIIACLSVGQSEN
jgi:hypothetical protein